MNQLYKKVCPKNSYIIETYITSMKPNRCGRCKDFYKCAVKRENITKESNCIYYPSRFKLKYKK